MKIRVARIQDAESIAIQNRVLAEESEQLTLEPETVRAGVQALLSDETKGFYLVAEENGKIIGQLMITREWSDWRNKPIWWVQSVYVKKEWRRKGVFTKLLIYVQHKADEQGVAFLRLYAHKSNQTALQVYEKIGWKQDPYVLYHLPGKNRVLKRL
jgi:GNAT superfamily N-acetyltransferase